MKYYNADSVYFHATCEQLYLKKAVMNSEIDALTANGAVSYSTTGNILVDLFTKSTRGVEINHLHYLLEEAFKVSPVDAVVLLFQARDCRGGKGEKDVFYEGMRWLMAKNPNVAISVLEIIPEYGYFKDWLCIFAGTEFESEMVQAFATRLQKDKCALLSNSPNDISLAVKYAPKEGRMWDTKHHLATKLASALGVNKAQMRKEILSPLNMAVRTVEIDMCANNWENIDFSKVPSRAMHIYRKAWIARQEKRFTEYLERAKAGNEKMNVGQLHPHEIVEKYISTRHMRSFIEDDMVEAQWSQFMTLQREKFATLDIEFPVGVPLIDVSGSMCNRVGGESSTMCLNVAVSLGLFIAEMTPGRFHNKSITFTTTPEFVDLNPGGGNSSLCSKVEIAKNAKWGYSTNMLSAIDLILDTATGKNDMFGRGRVPQDEMPKILWVLSDMQFDEAGGIDTNFEVVQRKYKEAGYEMPTIVFWNLSGKFTDFPVTVDNGVNTCILSGFSIDTLKSVMIDPIFDPAKTVRRVIDDKRYDPVREVVSPLFSE